MIKQGGFRERDKLYLIALYTGFLLDILAICRQQWQAAIVLLSDSSGTAAGNSGLSIELEKDTTWGLFNRQILQDT